MIEAILVNTDYIAEQQRLFRAYFEKELPAPFNSETHVANVLEQLMAGKLQAWALQRPRPKDTPQLLGFCTTMIVDDFLLGERVLWIYSVNSNANMTDEDWGCAFARVERFAREHQCQKVSCRTTQDNVKRLAERRGMSQKWTYLEKELPNVAQEATA